MASLNLGRGSVFLLSGAGTVGGRCCSEPGRMASCRRGCWPPGPAVTPGEVALGRASSVAWGSVATPALAHPPWRWPRRARGPIRLRVRPLGGGEGCERILPFSEASSLEKVSPTRVPTRGGGRAPRVVALSRGSVVRGSLSRLRQGRASAAPPGIKRRQ